MMSNSFSLAAGVRLEDQIGLLVVKIEKDDP